VKRDLIVLDASVGVKWLKPEAGSARARDLLDEHRAGSITLAVSDVFVYEVLDVARRRYGHDDAEALWARLRECGPIVVPTGPELFPELLAASRQLDCSLYDAAAPALAHAFDARLASADAGAHGRFPDVELVGE
jgi:predicted nucleic acid-binding protein